MTLSNTELKKEELSGIVNSNMMRAFRNIICLHVMSQHGLNVWQVPSVAWLC